MNGKVNRNPSASDNNSFWLHSLGFSVSKRPSKSNRLNCNQRRASALQGIKRGSNDENCIRYRHELDPYNKECFNE